MVFNRSYKIFELCTKSFFFSVYQSEFFVIDIVEECINEHEVTHSISEWV